MNFEDYTYNEIFKVPWLHENPQKSEYLEYFSNFISSKIKTLYGRYKTEMAHYDFQ